ASSCGLAPLVVKVAVPISRAASGPSGFTSRVVSLMSPGWCCIWPAQNFWMSARPFTIGAGRQHIGIGRVQRHYCAGIARVESGGPLVIELLDCLLALRQRWAGKYHHDRRRER